MTSHAVDTPEFGVDSIVGSYRIVERVGVGGMGEVYRAQHALIGRAAAIKVLHPELSGNRDHVNRFFNEAKATGAIKHPGIVEIFDYGYMPSGAAYIVMEFLDGETLKRRLRTGGRFAEGEAAMLVRGICSALTASHAKGIVHRDLKPDNIFLVLDEDSPLGERIKLLDFGVAKLTDIGLATSTTKTGAVIGTPTYMSPEQCSGTGKVDARADLYSLGCILYELLCGRPPFTLRGAGELIGAHLYAVPDPPSKLEPTISTEMEALIVSLLEKEPGKRPQTAGDVAKALAAIATQRGLRADTPVFGTTMRATRLSRSQPLPPVPNDHPSQPPDLMPDVEISSEQTVAPVPVAQPHGSRRGLGVALGAVGLVAGVIAVIVVLNREPETGNRQPAAVAPAPAAIAPVATPSPPPAPAIVVAPPAPVTAPAEPTPAPTTTTTKAPPARVATPARTATARPPTKTRSPTPPADPTKKPADKPADTKINGPIETDL